VVRGDEILTPKTVHAETPDGTMKLDAQKAVCNRTTARLVLDQAVGAQVEQGKETGVGPGPQGGDQNDLLGVPARGSARRLDDGSTVSAETIRWNQKTARLEATGKVRLETAGMWLEGGRFVGNTSLKKGRMTGKPHGQIHQRPR